MNIICAWCGWNVRDTKNARTLKDGRTVCATCIREETQED